MKDKQKEAEKYFSSGYNCSQSVLSVFSKELGIDKNMATKLATGFGGGMKKGEVCGAVTGALMVIGLKYGTSENANEEAKQNASVKVLAFQEEFVKQNGSLLCKTLLGYNLSVEDELKIIEEKGLFRSICPDLVKCSVAIVEELDGE